jgi:hypothetical protein
VRPVNLRAKIRIPAGNSDLNDRLRISSQFVLSDSHFTNPEVQDKIDVLSRRGLGEPRNTEVTQVPSPLTASMSSASR